MPGLIATRITHTLRSLLLGISGISVVGGLVNVPRSLAQSADAVRPEFDVASVKPTDPRSRETINIHRFPGGRVTATSVTLKILISLAYGVQDIDLFGGPDRLDRARFDIAAQAGGDAIITDRR
jgi:hypothetical protein